MLLISVSHLQEPPLIAQNFKRELRGEHLKRNHWEEEDTCPVGAFFYLHIYVIRTSSENMISYWWMKEIYSKLPYHYKKNLKGISS